MSGAVAVCPGSRFAFDGEVVEVTGFEGTREGLVIKLQYPFHPKEVPMGRIANSWLLFKSTLSVIGGVAHSPFRYRKILAAEPSETWPS